MDGIGLTTFDMAALAIIVISGVMAFARGLIREVFSIVAFFVALAAAIYGHGLLAPALEGMLGTPLFAALASGFLIFLVVFVAITIVTSMLARVAHASGEIGAIDRAAGLIFGAARGILLIALLVFLVRTVTGPAETTPQAVTPSWLTNARLYPFFERTAMILEGLGPRAKSYIEERKSNPDAEE